MTISMFKFIAFIAVFATGLMGGLLSKWVSESKKSALIFSLGNAFAGGVFLGAGLIHMMPDAQQEFRDLTGTDYPWFAVVCCVGFLSILFLEKIAIRHSHSHDDTSMGSGQMVLYPYVLMIILSIHSIIVGIALGTEARIAQVAVILIAVVAHKGTAAFSLTVSLLRGSVQRGRVVAMVVLFSFMTPLGILLGLGFMALLTGQAEKIFEAGFDALAAGTFLYVALLDILEEEFAGNSYRPLKFVFVFAGLAIMAVVAIWT